MVGEGYILFCVAMCVRRPECRVSWGSAAFCPSLEPVHCFLALVFSSSVPVHLVSGVKR